MASNNCSLYYAYNSGMQNVIIACDKNNIASAKTAISCDGVLVNEFVEDGIPKQHYFIDLLKREQRV